MHLYTVVRVRAKSAEDSISEVNYLLEDHPFEGCPFDYFDREGTALSERVKTEEDFQKQRQVEIECYKKNLEDALKLPDDDIRKAWLLKMAGQALDPWMFNSTERIVYDYAKDRQEDIEEEGQVFFVETDRHY